MSTYKYVADPVREQPVTVCDGYYDRVPNPHIPLPILRDWLGVTDETRLGVAPETPTSVIVGPEVPCSIDRCKVSHTHDGPRTKIRKATAEYLELSGGETLRYELLEGRRIRVSRC